MSTDPKTNVLTMLKRRHDNKLRDKITALIGTALSVLVAIWPSILFPQSDLIGAHLRSKVESFDFGYAPQHAQIAHGFWIHNVGTETARITKVKPNCGCTEAPISDSVIAPGDSAKIEIILGTGRMFGHIEKHTRVQAEAIGRVPYFTIAANVLKDGAESPPLSVEPEGAYVDSLNPPALIDGRWEITMILTNNDRTARSIRAVDVPSEFVELSKSAVELAPGQSETIVFQINPTLLESEFGRSVTLEADGSGKSRLTIPVGRRPEM